MPKINLDVGDTKTLSDVEIPVAGKLKRDELKINEVEVQTDMAPHNEKAAMLAFMEEPVTIFVHETTNPNEEQFCFNGVNGEYPVPGVPWLQRGKEYTVKRKFVANWLTAKTTTYTQPFAKETTDKANYMRPHTAVRYPFSIIQDSQKGMAWAKELMR